MEEKEYYSENGVSITNKRVLTSFGTTIAVSQITSVTCATIVNDNDKWLKMIIGLVLAFPAFFLVIKPAFQSIVDDPGFGTKFLVSTSPLLLGAAIGWKLGKIVLSYRFSIGTSDGHHNGYESPDQDVVQRMVDSLNSAIVENSQTVNADSDAATEKASPQLSAADEILKFKNLFDAGVISQDEFEQKKKQILDL